jgi:hypothetical protein
MKNENQKTTKAQKYSDAQIVESMRVRGGGFASALAEACLQADSSNLSKIKRAFSDLWREHDELLELEFENAFGELKRAHAELRECIGLEQ